MPQKSTNLPGIVKVRKTSHYTMINSNPIQKELEDLRSIGLLAYCLSMDESYVLYKSNLHNKFSRRNADAAIKELTEKNYWYSVKLRDGNRNVYVHAISDEVFTADEIISDVQNLINQGYTFMDISTGYENVKSQLSKIDTSEEPHEINDFSGVRFEQLNLNSSESTTNYYQLNNNQLNNNQNINDEIETLQRNNVVIHSNNNIDQRLEKIKNDNLDISESWIDDVFSKGQSKGLKNPYGYVVRAIKKFRENISSAENQQLKKQVESNLPDWFKNGDHKNHENPNDEKQNDESSKQDAEYFEEKRKELLSKIGYTFN